MCYSKRKSHKVLGITVILISFLIVPTFLPGIEAAQNTRGKSLHKADYDLTVKEGLITLKAKDASLKEILEAIGQELEIEVVATIPV